MIKHREEKLTRKGRDVDPVALRTHARQAARGVGGGGRPRSRSLVGSGVAEGCRAVLSPPRSEGAAFREEAREAVGLGDESVDVTSG